MPRKTLISALILVLVVGGLAWLNRIDVMLALLKYRSHTEKTVADNREIIWQAGPEQATIPIAERPPNIILIVADDLGINDVSTFGGCTSGPTAALENIRIIEEENLLDNAKAQGDYLFENISQLHSKHAIIGDIRGKGLLAGLELVTDHESKQPVEESVLMKIAGHCLTNGVMIGRTNRSFREHNNTLVLSPALICTRNDIDRMINSLDDALSVR